MDRRTSEIGPCVGQGARLFCIDSNLRKAKTSSATASGMPVVRPRNRRLSMPSPSIGLAENAVFRCFTGRCKNLGVHNGGLGFLKSFLPAVRSPQDCVNQEIQEFGK